MQGDGVYLRKNDMAKNYISAKKAAELIGCSVETIKKRAVAGKLGSSYKQGRAHMISRRAAESMADAGFDNKGRGRPRVSKESTQ